MENRFVKICSVIVFLFGVVKFGVASDLPGCPIKEDVSWHKCFGTAMSEDGEQYIGEWKNGYKNGQGTSNYSADGGIYVGEWKNGQPNGQGAYTFANGGKYIGEYKYGKMNGQGVYTYPSGGYYSGEWKNGHKSGQGTYTFSNGGKYVGQFEHGDFSGQGTLTSSDGTVVKEGIWDDDEFQYAKVPTKPTPVVKAPTKPVPVAKIPPKDDEILRASSGSGFAVSSDGYVVTNNHVIESCQEVMVHTKQRDIKMRVITYDTQNDLALLKGDFTPTSVFPLSTKRPELLQDIYVAGYPFGINLSSSVKVTKGIISSLTGIGNNFSNIQIDAAIQSGNSGGPILDEMGNIVGVAVAKLDAKYAFEKFGDIPENTNFGIKASVVKSVLDSSSVDVPSANTNAISKSELGKMITDGTYYISCWMTLAQIEKVRSKKVLFSELD